MGGRGKYYIKTCRGEDAKHRVSTLDFCKNIMSKGHNLRKVAQKKEATFLDSLLILSI
jgi:hypothetical protein